MNIRNRFNRHFLEPDTGANATTGAAPAIAAVDSPTGTAIPVTPPAVQPAAEIIQPLSVTRDRAISAPGPKLKAVDVAKELGMSEAPSRAVERMAKATRDKITGRFKPQPAAPRKPKAAPAAATAPETAPKPAAAAAATATPLGEPIVPPVTEPKIKFRGEEKTAAEWEKVLADEETARQKPPETEKKVEPAAAPQKTKAEQRTAYLDGAAEYFAPSQEDFDAMLASGDRVAFGRMLAQVSVEAREWAAAALAEQNAQLERMGSQLTPLAQQQQQIAQFQTENQFLDANPTIKGHADGLRTMRETATELHAEHDDMAQFLKVSPNSPNAAKYAARVKELETDFLNQLSKATKAKLGVPETTATPPPVQTTRTAAPVTAKPRPPAQTGLVGVSASPNGNGGPSSEIAAMRARGLM